MTQTPSDRPARRSPAQKITLAVLGLLVLGTIFLLPRMVTEPWIAGDTVEREVPVTPSADTVAPSTAAELRQYRQESQSVLAEIVAMRDRLVERSVERWAAAGFQQALGRVERGDELYSYGDYEASLSQYRDAREQLSGLEAEGDRILASAKTDGIAAVESLNTLVAAEASELASAMAPDDPDVRTLVARTATLEQVARHIEAGDEALSHDRFELAREEYRKALDLDDRHQRASDGLERARREVTGGAFRSQMSRGFAALEAGDFEGARAAFRQAQRIEPGNGAVSQALAQVDNRESMGVVNAELARAADFAASEQWAEAVDVYESLLEKDPSLNEAKARLIPVRVRAALDERLRGYIEEPLRMSNRDEYEAAREALQDARGIPNPEPGLQAQIAALETLLERATSPVQVVFRSDNQTDVVLYRVAQLGRFERREMQLRPGRYIAAGTREGYRDVRVEFTITGEPRDEPIVVRCEEPVG